METSGKRGARRGSSPKGGLPPLRDAADVSRRFNANNRRRHLIVALFVAALALIGWWRESRDGAGGQGAPADAPPAGQARPSSPPGSAYTLTGKVLEVTDGDTIAMNTAEGRRRIRLASIDAPEREGKDRPGQPHGDASRHHLAGLVEGKTLTARCFEQDRYERHICDLVLADGQTANRRQVEAGMAWANQEGRGKFLRDKDVADLERQARQAGRGLWQAGQGEPVRPWEWRYQCWQKGRCG